MSTNKGVQGGTKTSIANGPSTGRRRNTITQLNKVLPVPIELESASLENNDLSKTCHITDVLVGDYHIIQGENGTKYLVWAIRVIINDASFSSIVVYRRYSDIERFRASLVRQFPKEDIPPLPPKDLFNIQRVLMADQWLEVRRKGLQWFMTNALLNPKFQKNRTVTDFILT